MTSKSPTKEQVAAVVKQRDELFERIERINATRDRVDAAIAKVKARSHELAAELAAARIDTSEGDDDAAKRVEALKAERESLRAQYTEQTRMGTLNKVQVYDPHGELSEQRTGVNDAMKRANTELLTLYRDHPAEFLAAAAPTVAAADKALAKAIEAVDAARNVWQQAASELHQFGNEAGIGQAPKFPIEVDTRTWQLRPRNVEVDDLATAELAVFRVRRGGMLVQATAAAHSAEHAVLHRTADMEQIAGPQYVADAEAA